MSQRDDMEIAEIVATTMAWSRFFDDPKTETQLDADRENFRERWRVRLGLLNLQLILIPFAIARGVGQRRHVGGYVRWRIAEAHVFGVRVARWVIGDSWYVPDAPADRPRLARLRPNRNRRVRRLR